MIPRIGKGSPIVTRPAGTASVRGVQVLRMPDVIFGVFPRMGRAGGRETWVDRAGDSLPIDVPRRDPEQGRADGPMPRRPCKGSSLGSPEGRLETDSLVRENPVPGKPAWRVERDPAERPPSKAARSVRAEVAVPFKAWGTVKKPG